MKVNAPSELGGCGVFIISAIHTSLPLLLCYDALKAGLH